MPKLTTRLDLLIVERGLLPSRAAAQTAIMDGGVLVNGNKIDKPGTAVALDANVEILASHQASKYVSRGGFKLEHALQTFHLAVAERICLDLGSSTGGFTDCLLQNGAALVHAIDVGYGQLDWKLRQDRRVKVHERVNVRYLSKSDLYGETGEIADLAVIDVSFISLSKVLPACLNLLQMEADIVALIKPQFEAGRSAVGKGGVVRDPKVQAQVLSNTLTTARQLQLLPLNLTYSPIKGPAGNIEFLAHFKKHVFAQANSDSLDIETIVEAAQQKLQAK